MWTPNKDPTLFSGTVKFNLDPENQRTEEECENAIRICKLEKTIDQCGGLFGEIKRGGSNFSGKKCHQIGILSDNCHPAVTTEFMSAGSQILALKI